jgi:hypothetical protein
VRDHFRAIAQQKKLDFRSEISLHSGHDKQSNRVFRCTDVIVDCAETQAKYDHENCRLAASAVCQAAAGSPHSVNFENRIILNVFLLYLTVVKLINSRSHVSIS